MVKSPTVSYPLEMQVRGADKVIMYLNEISSYDSKSPSVRYIEVEDSRFNISLMSRELDLDRKTIRSIMKKLEDKKVLAVGSDRVIINGKALAEFYLYSLSAYSRKKLSTRLPVDSIDVLFYLSRKYEKYTLAKKDATFSISEIEKYLGVKNRSNSSYEKALGIIDALYGYKLIDLAEEKVEVKGNRFFLLRAVSSDPTEHLSKVSRIKNIK